MDLLRYEVIGRSEGKSIGRVALTLVQILAKSYKT